MRIDAKLLKLQYGYSLVYNIEYMMSKKDTYFMTYNRLVHYFPDKPWIDVLAKLEKNQIGYDFIENTIPYSLCLLENKEFEHLDIYEHNIVANTILYMSQLINFYETIALDKKKYISRWNASFYAASDMRALLFEIFVYYALKNKNWSIEVKDDDMSGNTYDYLALKHDEIVQIECKSFAYDKGLIINSTEALNLRHFILKSLDPLRIKYKNTEKELFIITLKINKKIQVDSKFLAELSLEINEKIYLAENYECDKYSINIQQYTDVYDINSDISSILPLETDDIELECLVSGSQENQNRFCLRITTIFSNNFWREFEKVSKDAAKNQLHQDKPASIIIHTPNNEIFKAIINDKRFIAKRNNIFNQNHLVSMVLITNTMANQNNEYPYLYVSPIIKEFINENSKFTLKANIF